MDKDKFSDELISAYLDNELSEADRKRVEDALMDSADHRQLFNELKSLHESFQSLPEYKLGDDFSRRVLERAESERSARPLPVGEAEPPLSDSPEPSETVPFVPSRPERVSLRNALTWVTAVAALLLLTLFIAPRTTDNDPNPGSGPVAVNSPNDNNAVRDRGHAESVEELQRHGEPTVDPIAADPAGVAPGTANFKNDGTANLVEAAENGSRIPLPANPDGGRQELAAKSKQNLHFQQGGQLPKKRAEEKSAELGPAEDQNAFVPPAEQPAFSTVPGDPLLVIVEPTARVRRPVELALRRDGFVDAESMQQELKQEMARRAPSAPAPVDAVEAEKFAANANRALRQEGLRKSASNFRMLVVESSAAQMETTLSSLKTLGYDVQVHRETGVARELERLDGGDKNQLAREARGRFADVADKVEADEAARSQQKGTALDPQADAPPAAKLARDKLSKDARKNGVARSRPQVTLPGGAPQQTRVQAEGSKSAFGSAAGLDAKLGAPQPGGKSFYRVPDDVSANVARRFKSRDLEDDELAGKKNESTDRALEGPAKDEDVAGILANRKVRVYFLILDAPAAKADAAATKEEERRP